MAIIDTAKANGIIRRLNENIAPAIANSASGRVNSVRQTADANGYPMLILSRNGNEAEGQPVIAIRVLQMDAISKDVFGNSLNAYSPVLGQMSYELDNTAQAKVQIKDLEKIMFQVSRAGMQVQMIEIAAGTAVTAANMNAASAAETYDDTYWPLKGA